MSTTSKIFLIIILVAVAVFSSAWFLWTDGGETADLGFLQNAEREAVGQEMIYVTIAEKARSPELCRKIYPLAYEVNDSYYTRSACLSSVAFSTKDEILCSDVKEMKTHKTRVSQEICAEAVKTGRYLSYGSQIFFGTNFFDKKVLSIMGYSADDVRDMLRDIEDELRAEAKKQDGTYDAKSSEEHIVWRTYQWLEKKGFTIDGYASGLEETEDFGWVDEELLMWLLFEKKILTSSDFKERLVRLPDFSTISDHGEAKSLFERFSLSSESGNL